SGRDANPAALVAEAGAALALSLGNVRVKARPPPSAARRAGTILMITSLASLTVATAIGIALLSSTCQRDGNRDFGPDCRTLYPVFDAGVSLTTIGLALTAISVPTYVYGVRQSPRGF